MRISIITLTIDTPQYFEEAVASVERENAIDVEHIVVHDGDEGFASDLAERHPDIKIVKGQNAGATAAAALGVEMATGDFILFLHSDDRLNAKALSRLRKRTAARPDVKIWTGGVRIFRTLPDGSEALVRLIADRSSTRLSLGNICDDIPLLTARFCHRSVYAQLGNFDCRFSNSSDREFLLRALIAGISEDSLDMVVSEMRLHEGSRTIRGQWTSVPPYLAEHAQIADMWIARTSLDVRTRRFLRNWRARELLRLIFHQSRTGAWKSAAATMLRASQQDPLWIFRIVTVLVAQRRRRQTKIEPGA